METNTKNVSISVLCLQFALAIAAGFTELLLVQYGWNIIAKAHNWQIVSFTDVWAAKIIYVLFTLKFDNLKDELKKPNNYWHNISVQIVLQIISFIILYCIA